MRAHDLDTQDARVAIPAASKAAGRMHMGFRSVVLEAWAIAHPAFVPGKLRLASTLAFEGMSRVVHALMLFLTILLFIGLPLVPADRDSVFTGRVGAVYGIAVVSAIVLSVISTLLTLGIRWTASRPEARQVALKSWAVVHAIVIVGLFAAAALLDLRLV